MVNGPPCAVCGNALRWIPQQNGWGCDRCQRMFPASGPGAPQAQAPQPPQGFTPPQQQGFGAPAQGGGAKTMFAAGAPPMARPNVGGSSPGSNSFPPPANAPSPWAPQNAAPLAASPYAAPQAAPPAASPYAAPQPAASPYAPSHGGAYPPQGGAQPVGASPYAQPGAPPAASPYPQPQQPYGAPSAQPAYSPVPTGGPAVPAAAPTGAKKGGKGLIIGLVVAVVAVGGGIAAFLVLRGGGDGGGAGGSRTAVVKATLSALADGDVDKLLALSDPVGLQAKVVDCKKEPADDGEKQQRDPKKQLEKQKEEWAELAPRTKGAKLELVEIVTKEPDAPTDDAKEEGDDRLLKKGDDLMPGCVAKVPMRFHLAKIKLEVTPPDGKPIETENEIGLAQIGKGFWLVKPPRISLGAASLEKEFVAIREKVCACKDYDCAKKLKAEFKESPRAKEIKKELKELKEDEKDKLDKIEDEIKACEKKLASGSIVDGLTQLKDKMCACADKSCADKVMQELTVWSKQFEGDMPTGDVMEQMQGITEEMMKCMMKHEDTTGIGGIGGTIAGAAGEGDFPPAPQLPDECETFRQTLVRISNCSAYPQSAKQSLIDSWKTMSNLTNIPESAKKTMADTCEQSVKAMNDAARSIGC